MPPPDYTKMDRYALIGQLERQDRIIKSLLRHIEGITYVGDYSGPPPLSKAGRRATEKRIRDVVKLCHGDKVAAAKIIGVCVKTIYNYLNRIELREGNYRDHRYRQNGHSRKQREPAPVG